ncbi:MAG: helix-turn-helix domain-containing protein [Rectinemataceae bacterium]
MIGDRIKRKRQALGLSLQDLADRLEGLGIRLSRAALSNYENNKATPNAKTLWGIAKLLEASMDYFVEERNVEIVLQGFRKKASATQTKVDQMKAFVLDELEKRMELDSVLGEAAPKDLPVQTVLEDPAEAEGIARKTRKVWELGDQPIASVSTLLEARGWYVLEVPDDPEFDGVAGYVESNHRPFAVSRRGIPVDRTRLNLLHEAGHAFVACADEKENEKAAFRFATAILFPKECVFDEIGRKRESITMDELLYAKKKYGLSMQAIVFRLRDLEVISDSYFTLFFRYFSQMGFRKEEPGSKELKFQEEAMALGGKVHRAFAEGLITEADAARLLPGFRVSVEAPGRIASSEIKRILSLPTEERERILAASAEAVKDAYENPDVNISGLVDDIIEYT